VTDAALFAAISATGLPWRVRDRRSGIELLLVPPGNYKRGVSPGDTEAFDFEKPAHNVRITKAFYLGRYEVMESEWRRVKDNIDATLTLGTPQLHISHDDISAWLQLSDGLRLPTEAEWEYACRAGTNGARYGDLDSTAVYSGNSGGSAERVGSKVANALGLHDMLGNAWEWCADWSGSYDEWTAGAEDPTGPISGDFRVLRGGSFATDGRMCRASHRNNDNAANRGARFGFRVMRTP
jgi:formylglycine-generating enzyme required for sulfatase activity